MAYHSISSEEKKKHLGLIILSGQAYHSPSSEHLAGLILLYKINASQSQWGRSPHGTQRLGGEVEAVVVVGAEGRVALGAFALARLVARAQAVPAEHVEALGQHRVLAFHLEKIARKLNCRNCGENTLKHCPWSARRYILIDERVC